MLISRKVPDDTREVVSPNAVQYLGSAKAITLSRVVLYKDGTETSFPLTRDTYTMGRHRNNAIVITDPKVSSFHARIDRTQDGFCLVDLKSRNGSYLNGKRIESVLLRTADEIRLGTARLIYHRLSDVGLLTNGAAIAEIPFLWRAVPCAERGGAVPRRPTTSSRPPIGRSPTRATRATSCASS
jgi:pSer/pThr/pTyr-binding forkhead associated (FHA) protein